MGRCATLHDITKELRDDLGPSADEAVARMAREAIEGMGYHPVADPVLRWIEVTETEAAIQESVYGFAVMRPGDWHVRGVVEVAEETEIK
jgi:hypothetical protein